MTASVGIVATGAQTCLGLSAAPSAAAVRAGVSGVCEHPHFRQRSGSAVCGALAAYLDPALTGSTRLAALALPALEEACTALSGAPEGNRQIPLYVGVSELRPGFGPGDVRELEHEFRRIKRRPIAFSPVVVLPNGHAAGLLALKMGMDAIQEGVCDACVVGGVDSYFHVDTIQWLDEHRQLAGETSRSGFVPGEGAGFCVLMSSRAAERLGIPELLSVLTVSTGREACLIKTADTCLGEGLTGAVGAALDSLPSSALPIDDVICDINGERYRGEEWAFVSLKLSQHFADVTGYQSPAECWGDVGAASGPLFAMLACQAETRGYNKGPSTMVWASSESGLRAAAVLRQAVV